MKPKIFLSFLIVFAFLTAYPLADPVDPVTITFTLDSGGAVAFGGSGVGGPLTTTDGTVESVTNGTTTLGITGGLLNFSTGNYSGSTGTSGAYVNTYAAGGTLTITGDVGSGNTTLLSATFSQESTFQFFGSGFATFSGLLDVTDVDDALAAALGFEEPAISGVVSQVELFFPLSPTEPGAAFSGTQVGGVVSALDPAPLPEPASFALLTFGLAGLLAFRRLSF